jgi:hypothetical protein
LITPSIQAAYLSPPPCAALLLRPKK